MDRFPLRRKLRQLQSERTTEAIEQVLSDCPGGTAQASEAVLSSTQDSERLVAESGAGRYPYLGNPTDRGAWWLQSMQSVRPLSD